jgi:hypothetical protein
VITLTSGPAPRAFSVHPIPKPPTWTHTSVALPSRIFENKPESCPFGHQPWPGKAQVSWTPCLWEPAREAAGRGRGMGHVRVACNSCHHRLRQTVFFEPPHDSGHRPLTGWVTGPDAQP